jgi:uncharacterized protein with NRDE domain
MCTLAIFFKVFGGYPLVIAANRDEHYDRPSLPPSLISAEPKILAGQDLTAGGTWLGVNEFGLLVAILNRKQNQHGSANLPVRSRGLLALDLLRLRNVRAAAAFLSEHRPAYNPFTVVYADAGAAGVAFNQRDSICIRPLKPGLHVFSSAAELDTDSGKALRAHDRFCSAAARLAPDNDPQRWIEEFQRLLSDHTADRETPRDAICVHGPQSGTVSSSIIYFAEAARRFETYFCAGPPCQNSFGATLTLETR